MEDGDNHSDRNGWRPWSCCNPGRRADLLCRCVVNQQPCLNECVLPGRRSAKLVSFAQQRLGKVHGGGGSRSCAAGVNSDDPLFAEVRTSSSQHCALFSAASPMVDLGHVGFYRGIACLLVAERLRLAQS